MTPCDKIVDQLCRLSDFGMGYFGISDRLPPPPLACEILDAYQIRTGSIQHEACSSIGHVKPDLQVSQSRDCGRPSCLPILFGCPHILKTVLWVRARRFQMRSRRLAVEIESERFRILHRRSKRSFRHHRCSGRSLRSLISVTSLTAGVNRHASVS